MRLDAIYLNAIKDELLTQISGSKIDKIMQPERDVIVLSLRGSGAQTDRLLICAGASDARVHLTEYKFINPKEPPMFCMLLRKHITGAKIIDITQPPHERILEIKLQTSSAIGIQTEKSLILELFGRRPNIILVDKDAVIIDCLRRISGEINNKRILLPGLKYHAPAPRDNENKTDIMHVLDNHSKNIDGKYQHENISRLLDELFTYKRQHERIKNRSTATLRTVKTVRKRIVRRLAAQQTDLKNTENKDKLRESGDIIMANLHTIKKGQELLIADDFYSTLGTQRKIELDNRKTPQQNAARYYKAYTKAKNAVNYLTEQIRAGGAELEYIESVIEQINRVETERDLNEIREELKQTGYIKHQKTQRPQKSKETKSSPMRFISSSGKQIFAGRNNLQNDRLTLKVSAKTDFWFHTQKIHGAHITVSCEGVSPDEQTIKEAASIAAYYSAARIDGKVPVDYTMVKNVRKPPRGRPGMVIYTDYKTILVTPDVKLVKQLLVHEGCTRA